MRRSGEIKWRGRLVFVSEVLAGEPVGLLEQAGGRWCIDYGPIAWLKAFGEGACVIDWSASLRLHLGAKRLLISDRDLGNRLTRALKTPPAAYEVRMVAA